LLIIYEILNTLWKGVRLLKSIPEGELLAEVLRRVMRVMRILYTKGLDAGILRTSFQL
jgi:predicted nucleic acid-binding protein